MAVIVADGDPERGRLRQGLGRLEVFRDLAKEGVFQRLDENAQVLGCIARPFPRGRPQSARQRVSNLRRCPPVSTPEVLFASDTERHPARPERVPFWLSSLLL